MKPIEAGRPVPITAKGLFASRFHVFDARDVLAIEAAVIARRALLLGGEPGTGKSQFARAAAAELGWPFVWRSIDARMEPRDLMYEIDLVRRLADAQLAGSLTGEEAVQKVEEVKELKNYVTPGPLWRAFSWETAQRISPVSPDEIPSGWEAGQGVVVLLDEIDKADSEIPNGLLEALGDGVFEGPPGVGRVHANEHQELLIVITTNRERDLPEAFRRRCLVHDLSFPEDQKELVEFLVSRGKVHFSTFPDPLLKEAAIKLVEVRNEARDSGQRGPGLAEYLDLIRALIGNVIEEKDLSQTDVVRRISERMNEIQPFFFGGIQEARS